MKVDYIIFFEKRFDIVLRYHFFKKFGFHFRDTCKWFRSYKWSGIDSKLLFDEHWEKLDNIITENFLKANPYPISKDMVGLAGKRFILALHNRLPLYWVVKDEKASMPTKKFIRFSKKEIEKIISKKDFQECLLTMNDMILRMRELEFFDERFKHSKVKDHSKRDLKRRIKKILLGMTPDIHSGEKNIRFDKMGFYYHSVPNLGIEGYRTCSKRMKINNLYLEVKNKKVLDIGSNMGMMSIEAAKTAKGVIGIDTSKGYVVIANLLKGLYNLKNVKFINESFLEHSKKTLGKYDVIFALAVHNWVGTDIYTFMILCRNLLFVRGVVIFETHRWADSEPIINKIRKAGYKIEKIGKVDVDKRTTFRCEMVPLREESR